jgi:hypothetical protein
MLTDKFGAVFVDVEDDAGCRWSVLGGMAALLKQCQGVSRVVIDRRVSLILFRLRSADLSTR